MVMGKREIQNLEIIIKINEYTIIIVVTLIVHSRSGAAVCVRNRRIDSSMMKPLPL